MLQTALKNTESTLGSLLKDYSSYNLWANKKLVEWLKSKPSYLMENEIPSSFSSIKLTLLHISKTESWWLGNLKKLQPELDFRQTYQDSAEEAFERFIKQSEELDYFIQSLDENELAENCDFSIPFVGDFSRPRTELIQHCMNHSTYHRGQVVTIGRNLDLTDAPMTDYMFYLLMAKF